jgi:hypothetical protein
LQNENFTYLPRNIIFNYYYYVVLLNYFSVIASHGSRRSRTVVENEQNVEKLHSLLDAADDENDTDNGIILSSATIAPASLKTSNETDLKNSSSTAPPKKKAKDSTSRQITLPDDYNKLEIPKWKNLNFEAIIRKKFKIPDEEDISVKMAKVLPDLIPADEPILDITVDVKVRSIRDVDEINEV